MIIDARILEQPYRAKTEDLKAAGRGVRDGHRVGDREGAEGSERGSERRFYGFISFSLCLSPSRP